MIDYSKFEYGYLKEKFDPESFNLLIKLFTSLNTDALCKVLNNQRLDDMVFDLNGLNVGYNKINCGNYRLLIGILSHYLNNGYYLTDDFFLKKREKIDETSIEDKTSDGVILEDITLGFLLLDDYKRDYVDGSLIMALRMRGFNKVEDIIDRSFDTDIFKSSISSDEFNLWLAISGKLSSRGYKLSSDGIICRKDTAHNNCLYLTKNVNKS